MAQNTQQLKKCKACYVCSGHMSMRMVNEYIKEQKQYNNLSYLKLMVKVVQRKNSHNQSIGPDF